MNSFTERVKLEQEEQELHVFRVPKYQEQTIREPIDLICMNKKGEATLIRAREGGHEKPNRMTILRMQMLGKQCGARVLHAFVNDENEICFDIIYER